jgi:hypothetical protein
MYVVDKVSEALDATVVGEECPHARRAGHGMGQA